MDRQADGQANMDRHGDVPTLIADGAHHDSAAAAPPDGAHHDRKETGWSTAAGYKRRHPETRAAFFMLDKFVFDFITADNSRVDLDRILKVHAWILSGSWEFSCGSRVGLENSGVDLEWILKIHAWILSGS